MSLPHQLYVLEGDRGTIRCQNRSTDGQTFYTYVSNAVWWRHNSNGTLTKIRRSGSIYSSAHALHFNPISSENQGNYFCCMPDHNDESECSSISVVIQSSKYNKLSRFFSNNLYSSIYSSTQYQRI